MLNAIGKIIILVIAFSFLPINQAKANAIGDRLQSDETYLKDTVTACVTGTLSTGITQKQAEDYCFCTLDYIVKHVEWSGNFDEVNAACPIK